MSFQSAPNMASAAIDGVIGTKTIDNVLNFKYVGIAYDQAALDLLSAAVDNWVGNNYIPLIAVGVDYVQTRVRGLTNVIDLSSVNAASAGSGTASGATLPANVTACITARTGFTGRSARGRFYAFPNTQSALLTLQTWNSTYTTALATALNQLILDAGVAGWTMVVLSRYTLGAARATAIGTPIANWVVTNTKIDSQRNRLLPGH